MKPVLLATLVFSTSHCYAEPDGTVLMMYCDCTVGRIAQRITHDRYTHAAIVLKGFVYEADYPVVKRTPLRKYQRPRAHIYAFVPRHSFTTAEVSGMVQYAESHLGQRYGLRSYFHPNAPSHGRTWCSLYVEEVLNHSGRYHLTRAQGFEPQNLLDAIGNNYSGPSVVYEPSASSRGNASVRRKHRRGSLSSRTVRKAAIRRSGRR